MNLIDCSNNLKDVYKINKPCLKELCFVIGRGLKEYYGMIQVDIVKCPDFRQAPYLMTGSGIGSGLRIVEVGGIGNIYPVIKCDKFFDLKAICTKSDMPNAFVFGPGAGPWHVIGSNCEMVADANFVNPSNPVIASKIIKINADNKAYELSTTNSSYFSLMANLALSNANEPADVVHIHVKKRLTDTNFPESVRRTVGAYYGKNLVSIAGIFLVKAGKIKMHVMPNFPSPNYCWKSADELNREWLKYFEMSAPVICACVIHSTNNEERKLRMEHTHCYSEHGDGGHYHCDLSPEIVEYEGYFAPAESVYRIDLV